MKKFMEVISITIIILICFIIQIYALNKWDFFGVRANLLLVLCVAFSIWFKPNISIPIGLIIGVLSDLIFTFSLGKYVITYLILVLIIIATSTLYNKNNKGTTVMIILIATLLGEYIFGIYNLVKFTAYENIFSITLMGIKESIVNIILGAILTKILRKVTEK